MSNRDKTESASVLFLSRYENLLYSLECSATLYAFCLMGNHAHLLVKASKEQLESLFRRFGVSFVGWYNGKYERTGHLYKDRFKSIPVESAVSLWRVIRYILRNPVKAGMVKKISEYRYSSAQEYLMGRKGITDTEELFRIQEPEAWDIYFGIDIDDAEDEDTDLFLDIKTETRKKCTDQTAIKLIEDEFGTLTPRIPVYTQREQFYKTIRSLRNKGISIRQLSRITGISRAIISKA